MHTHISGPDDRPPTTDATDGKNKLSHKHEKVKYMCSMTKTIPTSIKSVVSEWTTASSVKPAI